MWIVWAIMLATGWGFFIGRKHADDSLAAGLFYALCSAVGATIGVYLLS